MTAVGLQIGDRVIDAVGDHGVVRKIGLPSVKTVPNFALSDPASVGPTIGEHPATVLVEWETLNGAEIFKQGSWEDVADLTLVPTP